MAHAGHAATASRSAVATAPPTTFPWLDHPPRGCRVPPPKARNRRYSYPSGGRVRALQWILRPWIPPNRPPNAQNGRESGFFGLQGARALPSRLRTHPRTDPQARSGSWLAIRGGSRRRVVGHGGATLSRGPRDVTGQRGRRPRPRNPWERGAVRGRRGGAPRQPQCSTLRVLADANQGRIARQIGHDQRSRDNEHSSDPPELARAS